MRRLVAAFEQKPAVFAEKRNFDGFSTPLFIVEKIWPHAPLHLLGGPGVYMVTGATLYKRHLFRGSERLSLLETYLLGLAHAHNWQLEAWAVFSNHYHFVARSQPESTNLGRVMKQLHAHTARILNEIDGVPGREVWFNFWDSRLTYQRSYLARLHYVHQNPVKHGLVPVANQYDWCSAAWFERTASPSMVESVYGMRIDRISLRDDYRLRCGRSSAQKRRQVVALQIAPFSGPKQSWRLKSF